MADIAYTVSPGRIKPLLDKIQDTSVPKVASLAWLASLGFTSSNDRRLIGVLRQVQFIDDAGKPTALWEQFRAGDGSALARGLRQGYDLLYQIYDDAHERQSIDLENLLRAKLPKLGRDSISRAVSTFKALVAQASFSSDSIEGEFRIERASPPRIVGLRQPSRDQACGFLTSEPPLSLTRPNLTVNLTLPESSDPAFYDRVFSSMKTLFEAASDLAAPELGPRARELQLTVGDAGLEQADDEP